MTVHSLAIFWRDLEARCFTLIHFLPAPKENAQKRANKILQLLDSLSSLRIYGAVLDDDALPINSSKSIPETGTEKRLEVDLLPDAPINPRAGVTKIKFSLPAPIETLYQTIENDSFSESSAWLALEKEILPFLCLPSGIKISSSPDKIKRCQIRDLEPQKRPLPGRSPVEAAIAATEQALLHTHKSSQERSSPDKTDLNRVDKYSKKLSHLQTLQQMEQTFWLTSQLPPVLIEQNQSAAKALLQLLQSPCSQENKSMLDNRDNLYLPKMPTQQEQWQDIPADHFSDPAIWLNRNQLKQIYGLNERSYFRWISRLEDAGLSRSLPSQQDDRVKLFYKPDLDRAMEKAAIATKKRGRPPRSLTSARTDKPGTEDGSSLKSSARGTGGSSRPQTSLEAQVASLKAQQLALQQQYTNLESSIKRIDDSLSKLTIERLPQLQDQITQIAQQLSAQTNQLSVQSPIATIIELLSQLTAFNQISHQIADLSKQLKRLPSKLSLPASKAIEPKNKPKNKAKPKTKTKTGAAKKPSKAKLKAKPRKPSSKTIPSIADNTKANKAKGSD